MENGEIKKEITRKLKRIISGNKLRTLDLFSGCGGLSLGFQRADFEIVAGVEFDTRAAEVHAQNIFNKKNLPSEQIKRHSTPIDITDTPPDRFMKEILHADEPDNLIDVIIGGPPCQAFSRVGRAKLRQIANDENAYLNDDRADLYRDFLGYVRFFSPLVVLMENVPDILNYGGKNVAEEIAVSLDELGYRCLYTLLNTANYGVPQSRLRFFLIGFHEETQISPEFPEPTHYLQNSNGLRNKIIQLKKIQKSQQGSLFDLPNNLHYISSPNAANTLPTAINVIEAIGDLPILTEHLTSGNRRSFNERLPYRNSASTDYSKDMRDWPGFEVNEDGANGHVIRLLPRDYPIFKLMQYGDEYPQALKIAEKIFQQKLDDFKRDMGQSIDPEGSFSETYYRLKKETVPPYDPHKFTSKWWKLNPELPSRTITAHLGKDTYSHIHYDSKQARVISVREAARLQSFPDGFQFTPTMASAFKQIGNSVPPLVAYAIAKKIRSLLGQGIK